jgi:A nuclease family of the HNH/ENDO VII superfamily with conserved AHH
LADEQDNPGDLRIPITVTIPWTGKRTRGGQPWPLDRQGRYWPSCRWGDPMCPLDEYPPGVRAPGTGPRSMTIEDAAGSYLATLDAEKAAIAEYGSRPITTLTVRPGGAASPRVVSPPPPAHPVQHGPGPATAHGQSLLAKQAARLGLVTVTLSVATADAEALGVVALLEAVGAVVTVIAGAIVALASAPEMLAAAALGAVGAVLLKVLGKTFWFQSWQEAQAFLSKALYEPYLEGFDPAATLPVLPPPPPPPVDDGGRNPGLVPADPMPAQPGFTPAAPVPLVPPAAAPHPPIGMVMESRNHGLEGCARGYSYRARAAARRTDHEVVRHLDEGEWVAHHLINKAAVKLAKEVIRAAVRAGWRMDGEGNVAALPSFTESQQKLRTAGVDRPIHNNGHPEWNRYVREELQKIRRDFRKFRSNGYSEEWLDNWAKGKLEKLENKLRRRTIGKDKITSVEDPHDDFAV